MIIKLNKNIEEKKIWTIFSCAINYVWKEVHKHVNKIVGNETL